MNKNKDVRFDLREPKLVGNSDACTASVIERCGGLVSARSPWQLRNTTFYGCSLRQD